MFRAFRRFILLVTLFFFAELAGKVYTPGRGDQPRIGESYPLPVSRWVRVEVPVVQQFINGENLLDPKREDAACIAGAPGTVTVLGLSNDNERVQVRYQAEGRPMGILCPSGSVFSLRVAELSNFRDEEEALRRRKEAERSEIRILLAGWGSLRESGGVRIGSRVPPAQRDWVTVMDKSEPCLVRREGNLTVLGFHSDGKRALVRYESEMRDVSSAACPSGTVFYTDVAKLK